MAIYKEDIVSIELENGVIHRSFLNHSIGSGDAAANRFGIRVFRNGSEVDLSGVSCQAYFQNAEGTNIALTSYGTVSGNVAYVTLPQACYNVEGQFCLAIKLIGGGVTGTMRIIDGMVCNTGTTGAVAPTSSVPTYQEILSTYAAMVSATSAANLAIAEEFDASENYPAGKNVINDGALYVLPNGHTAGTTWANTTKVASNLGDQVTDLKSAIMANTRNLWKWGNQNVTGNKAVTDQANIPAGTYTMSALINRSGTGNCRMVFYKESVISTNLLANPYIAVNSRNSVTFTLAEKADIIKVYSGPNESGEIPAEWTDIQIEAGSTATGYIPPETATDFVARENLAKFESETEAEFDAMYNPFDSVKEFEGTLTEGTYEADVSLPKNEEHPFIVCIDAKYTASGNAYPYLYFSIRTDRNLERITMRYKVGEKGIYDLKEYRSIPYVWDNRNVKVVVVVPSGCSLTVRKAYCYFDRSRNYTDRGLQFHAHDGCCGITPPQTLHAFKMAYAAGYNSAIVIPKVTSDGVWFAYHDDTFVVGSTYLRNADGTVITESEYNNMYFNEIPWSYLKELITGNYGATFADSHLMTLDDFFAFCAKTGISPMFSMHPRPGIQTAGALASLKALVKKYGLLDKLIIKMPLVLDEGEYNLSNFTAIFSVFGNDIAAYEVDGVQGMSNPESVITLFDGVSSGCTVRKVIEWWASQLSTDNTLIASAIASGYEVSCAQNSYTDISGETLSSFSSEFVKQMMTLGVTEFTDNYNMSNGLYW